MKKLIVILIALGSISTLSAQKNWNNNHNKEGYNNSRNSRNMDRKINGRDYAYSSAGERDHRTENAGRQREIERLNRDYDKRISGYRNDRFLNHRERERRIAQAERERSQKIKSFAGGAVVGAIAGVLLGVLIGSN